MALYEKFFHISHDLFCVLDHNGYYKKVNPAMLHLLGYTDEELKAHPFPYFVHPEDVETVKREYQKVVKGEHNQVIRNRFRDKNGSYHWISWSTIVQDDEGIFYSSGQNISTRIKLEEMLAQERRENEKKIIETIVQTQEKEKEQFSIELHDNVNQILTTVKLLLELSRDEKSNREELIGRAIELQQNAIDEIRALSKKMAVPAWGKTSLSESVQDLIQSVLETKTINIALETTAITNLFVAQKTHLTIYRILQEQLTNITKHAKATDVEIVFTIKNNCLTMNVGDNGIGFDVEKKTDGVGIRNMATRVAGIDGTLKIESGPGKGTLLVLQVPLLDSDKESSHQPGQKKAAAYDE